MGSETPYSLLPYQQAWVKDQTPVRIIEKSRRVGISWTAACEAVLDAAMSTGQDTWYVGYNKDMAQEFIRDCGWWAKKFNLLAGKVEEILFLDDDEGKQILTYAINFASGFRIVALSSRPTNLRGKRGHIILDEAAYHDDLAGLIKAAMAVLMWGGKARVDIISTHNGVEDYFYTVVEEVRAGKRPYSLHRVTLDDAIEQGLFKRICLMNQREWSPVAEAAWRAELFSTYGEAAAEELLCIPSRSGGVYLNRDVLERQMKAKPVFRLELDDGFTLWTESARQGHVDQWCRENLTSVIEQLPKDRLHFLGEDFGRSSDRTVLVPGTLMPDLKRTTPFVVEMLNVPFDQQKQVLFYILERLPMFTKAAFDATGNGSYLAEAALLKYGEKKIECVLLSEPWYRDNMPPLKAALEDGQYELARDADHLLDLSAIKVVNGTPKLPKIKTATTGRGPARHGDAAIAYALAYYASRQPIMEYSYQAPAKVVDLVKRRNPMEAPKEPSKHQGFKNKPGLL